MSLIPATTNSPVLNYFCTWGVQNYSAGARDQHGRLTSGDQSFTQAMDNLNEALLFGEHSWSSQFPAEARGDLILLLDVGWDVPIHTPFPDGMNTFGSLLVDSDRFPSCTGSPTQRLAKLRQLAQKAGWAGLGLWVSPQVPSHNTPVDARQYWAERAQWCQDAGVHYWKVDIGHDAGSFTYRSMMSQAARRIDPGLVLEHGRNSGPLNDVATPWDDTLATDSGRYENWGNVAAEAHKLSSLGGVLRVYDALPQLSSATILDRVATLLRMSSPGSNSTAVLNVEDEVYLGAALGCSFGVMRHPAWLPQEGQDYDPANVASRSDEVIRAVKWQRIAPPLSAAASQTQLSSHQLTDSWSFKPGDTWADFVTDRQVTQSAPAVVSRDLPLPEVTGTVAPPFVVASRWDHAVAIATLARPAANRSLHIELADVTLDCGETQTVGIFGRYCTLTLKTARPVRRVLMQDLAGDNIVDVTGSVQISSGSITVPGELLLTVCATTLGPHSDPGVVVGLES